MTPPDALPAGFYAEASQALRAGTPSLVPGWIPVVLDALAPLIATTVEEVEADAEQLAAALYPMRYNAEEERPATLAEHRAADDALAAHEARKATA